jgi:hypothetical protein
MSENESVEVGPLWVSDNPRYGVVRHVVVQREHAARFDDLNGDFREVCLTVHRRGTVGWETLHAYDDCGYPTATTFTLEWEPGGPVWVVGRDPWNEAIPERLRDAAIRVEPDSKGWFLIVDL